MWPECLTPPTPVGGANTKNGNLICFAFTYTLYMVRRDISNAISSLFNSFNVHQNQHTLPAHPAPSGYSVDSVTATPAPDLDLVNVSERTSDAITTIPTTRCR
ncbi:hypothetical protein KIF59_05630 [Enterobacter cloacae subsp. cloacae]|nr:hypothetical protein [Enterobacter cloacae subsp. cloacae]